MPMHDLLIRGATVVDGLGHARSAPTSRSRMVGRPASAARRADRRRNRTLTSCPARDPRSALRSGAASAPSVKASMRAAEASEYFRSCTPRASHKGVPAVSGTSSSNPLCSSKESIANLTTAPLALLLGHTKLESTVRYLGIEVD